MVSSPRFIFRKKEKPLTWRRMRWMNAWPKDHQSLCYCCSIFFDYISASFIYFIFLFFHLHHLSYSYTLSGGGGVIPAEREMRSFRYGGGVVMESGRALEVVVTLGKFSGCDARANNHHQKCFTLLSYYYYQHHILYLYNLSHFE